MHLAKCQPEELAQVSHVLTYDFIFVRAGRALADCGK
jgi:hypothetical protein